MNEQIVECVANYSEARNPDVIQEIIASIKSVSNVYLLDCHSDADHNRTVLTFAGPPNDIETAAFRSIKKASELINLDHHTGTHPRIGAADVVPFVPISGVKMDTCVAIARRLGQRVGLELRIPVYLYEKAAQTPERQNLENIRRGEYEYLKKAIATDPDRKPDFGPEQIGPAGATVIGARDPLIAYNIYLTTDDLSVAKNIARAVRHSSGGLRYVKALGMIVNGRAQVSMNITNYHFTPVARVVAMVRNEAHRYGVEIHHCELVGLIPQEALVDAAVWHLQLDQFSKEQILENRINKIIEQETSALSKNRMDVYLEALSAGTPTPGGGSSAALCGAQAAALVAMVARLTIGKKNNTAVESIMQYVIQKADDLRTQLAQYSLQDSEAYTHLLDAYRLPKRDSTEQAYRIEAIELAAIQATEVPMHVAGLTLQVLELAETVVREGNINAICDGGTAAILSKAVLSSAGLNIRTNTSKLVDQDKAKQYMDLIIQLESQAAQIEQTVTKLLFERGGLEV